MKQFINQNIPLFLTVFTFLVLSFMLYAFISLLNLSPLSAKILLQLHVADILVGLTIYLKTSVDFALFIGNLMSTHLGVKNRIAIEIGTALGNALGTCFVLLIWTFFKEVPLLMIAMIFLASLVLLHMAEEGLKEFQISNFKYPISNIVASHLKTFLKTVNSIFKPIVRLIVPHAGKATSSKKTFFALLLFALTIPLILGLDDFAGYIPLFSIINVFGFGIGVFLGHMLLNIALFASPTHTIRIVKQPFIAFLGTLAFIGIALWGFVEIIRIAILWL